MSEPLPSQTVSWLVGQLGEKCEPKLLFADASFRSYYRIHPPKSWRRAASLVLMYAPPQKESLQHYLQLANDWRAQEVNTPEIIAADARLGLALIEDFGDQHLASAEPRQLTDWYLIAFTQLRAIQGVNPAGLPDFMRDHFPVEMRLLPEWSDLKIDPHSWRSLCDRLAAELALMPMLACHRDFHCRNLMRIGDAPNGGAIGVLDFQDACLGPAVYDLASLVFDAYIRLPEKLVDRLVSSQAQALGLELPDLRRQLHLVALQRLLKVYGIFCRLSKRDHKPRYLAYLPGVGASIARVGDLLLEQGERWLKPHQMLFAELASQARLTAICAQ